MAAVGEAGFRRARCTVGVASAAALRRQPTTRERRTVSARHEATDSDTRGLHKTVLEELRSTVGGDVLVPGDETYDDSRAV